MSTLAIIIISALSGGIVTGGTIWGIQHNQNKKNAETKEVIEAIAKLESSLDKADAAAIQNLTETDLLKIPCSAEYIEKQGNDLLCREMFCRMNRQGSASGGGAGSTTVECEEISNMINSRYIISQCLQYWDENTSSNNGINQNSKYSQCLEIYGKRK